MIGIYKVTNPDGEVYIGQSKDIEKRFYTHKVNSSNSKLKESIKKHGANNHLFEVIEECSTDLLIKRERFFIEIYKKKCVVFNSETRRPRTEKTTTIRIPIYLKNQLLSMLNSRKQQRIINQQKIDKL